MYMNFTHAEMKEVFILHLVEKFGVPRDSIQSVEAITTGNGQFSHIACMVKTEKAVPAGPYRTNAKDA